MTPKATLLLVSGLLVLALLLLAGEDINDSDNTPLQVRFNATEFCYNNVVYVSFGNTGTDHRPGERIQPGIAIKVDKNGKPYTCNVDKYNKK